MIVIMLSREEWLELTIALEIALENQVMNKKERMVLERVYRKIDDAAKKIPDLINQ